MTGLLSEQSHHQAAHGGPPAPSSATACDESCGRPGRPVTACAGLAPAFSQSGRLLACCCLLLSQSGQSFGQISYTVQHLCRPASDQHQHEITYGYAPRRVADQGGGLGGPGMSSMSLPAGRPGSKAYAGGWHNDWPWPSIANAGH